MTSRRAPPGLIAAAALVPPGIWLLPALFRRQAPTFRDQGDFFFPLKLYTADRLRRGELPLWNPLSGCGEPWLANLQSGVFYPPGLFFFLPSAALAASLFLLFHFAVASWGMRAFLKGEGTSDAASFAGSVAFAASGFAASLSSYWNHFGAFAFLPGLAALARGGLSRRSDRLLFAALFALQALSGSPEMSAATLALALVLALRARRRVDEPAEGPAALSPGLRAARAAAASGLGVLLAAGVLVPFLELAAHSDRRGPLPVAEREAGGVGWQGVASAVGRSPASAGTSYLSSVAVGTLVLLLAAAAFSERDRRSIVVLLAAIGVAGIVLAATGPPGPWLRAIPPLDRFRYPAKALALPAFAIAALAGLGLDSVRFAAGARRRAAAVAGGAAGLLLVAFSAQPSPARLAEAAGIVVLALLAWIPAQAAPRTGALQWIVACLVAVSLAFAGRPLFRFASEGELRRAPADVAYLASLPGRVLTPPMSALVSYVLRDGTFDAATLRRQRDALLGYTNLLAGVRTLRTSSPLRTEGAKRIADAVDSATDPQRAAGAASGRLLWTPSLPPNMGSRRVGDFFRAPINPYRPRLSYVRSYSVEADDARAWSRASLGESDWSRTVQLDRVPSPAPIAGSSRTGFVVARIAEERPERVVAEVSSDSAGILVLTDLAYPGWRAEEDGHPAEILRADGLFRAVALPAGSHRVVFRYRPVSILIGAAISGLALLLWLSLARAGEPRRAKALL